ncbi:hypothetical protein [Tichowtungia aerotolerans]|uniref:Fibronectin type-III domain-containing protein n=1 Tax=Tichowtungia aerotolerans TaxID=2697043 RepID=A0A6P1MDX0_9BACT|nr:hypothetical protein [Tichowtungia aerotolerans]QHI70268.1 hypothetical protein GT409_12730 [Tichowtungia aerotolerans]
MTNTVYKFIVLVLFAMVAFGQAVTVTVEWDPASTTVDGEALEYVHCYKVFYGDTSGVYTDYVVVTNATSAEVELEYNKTHYFSVKTCTHDAESDYSEELVWMAPVMADKDADGLSDDWEMAYFGTLDAASGTSDYDHNGICDVTEFIAGTDPTDPLDSPALVSLGRGIVAFEARSAVGDGYENRARSYSLQYCEDLASGAWIPVFGMDQIDAEGQVVEYAVPEGGLHGFYRTQIQLN